MNLQIWPWVLGGLTLVIYALSGKKYWWVWLIALVKGTMALIYFTLTEQWGFVPMDILLIGIYLRNLYLWRKDDNEASL